MRLKKVLSAVISTALAACLTFSGISTTTATQVMAEETEAAAQKEAVVVNGYRNPVYDAQTDTTEWDYVYFGSYPQSEVTGDELTDAIMNAEYDDDDVAVVDGVKYKRVSAETATYVKQYNSKEKNVPAQEGEFYEWENKSTYHYFKFEPLKWRVLESNENGQLFLMADQAVDCMPYMPTSHKISWYITQLRSWMNEYNGTYNEPKADYSRGGFLSLAFSEAEKEALIETEVITEGNAFWGSYVDGMIGATADIYDDVYILSAEEATNEDYGFSPDPMNPSKTRQMKMTDYAFAKGGWAGSPDELQGNCWWLLRTPGDHEKKATLGYRDGRVYMEGYYSNLIPYACTVPVCHVDVNAETVIKVTEANSTPPVPTAPVVTPDAVASEKPQTPQIPVTPAGVMGDVDGNGQVELKDAQAALKAALKIDELNAEQTILTDVDGSGQVELKDAQLILQHALKIIDKFPVNEVPVTQPSAEPTVTPAPSATPAPEVSQEPLVQPEDNASGHVWIAGDSIAADHSPHNEANDRSTIGWGVIIGRYFSEDVVIHNTAISSKSSKSFIQEPEYQEIMEGMQAGDYLIISFGHNDEFPELARHTNPYGATDEAGSYKWYLKNYYIDPALRKGVVPVLISSVVERNFVDGTFNYQFHSVYKTAMEELVAEYKEAGITLAYIDLHTKMNELYTTLGDEATQLLHAKYEDKDSDNNLIQVMDNTHFTLAGARYATKYILEGFSANNLDIMKYANQTMIDTLSSIATPEKFYAGDIDEWITKPADYAGADKPVVPDTSGDAVTAQAVIPVE